MRRLFPPIAPFARTLLAVWLTMCGGWTMLLFAATDPPPDDAAAIESVRTALRSEADFPWYDAETDQLRSVDVSPQLPPPEASQWSWERRVSKRTPRAWNFGLSDVVAKLLQYAAWALLACLFLYGLYVAICTLLAAEVSLSPGLGESHDEVITDAERMENLPFDIRKTNLDLLDEARQRYQAGDYSQAMVMLFSYQLIQLDKHHWIRLAKGKTNRQYLREIKDHQSLQSLVRVSMVAFEDVFFGQHRLEKDRFEQCWGRLDEFQQLLQPEGVAP